MSNDATPLAALADRLQIALASRTPDGRLRTGDKVFICDRSNNVVLASGTIKSLSDDGRTATITTPVGDLDTTSWAVMHDMTGQMTKEVLSSLTSSNW